MYERFITRPEPSKKQVASRRRWVAVKAGRVIPPEKRKQLLTASPIVSYHSQAGRKHHE